MNCIKIRTQVAVKYCLSFTLAVLLFSSCNVKPSAEGKIVVDMARKGAEVPSSMYGVFFEEINHAGDGGLYAELVRNRSFEEKELPAGYHAEGDRLHPEPVKNHISGELSDQTYRWTTEDIPAWTLVSEGPARQQ